MWNSQLHSEQRSAGRFLVSLPVDTDRGPGITRDVSLSGLYLLTDRWLAAGDSLRLVVTLPDHDGAFPVRLSLKGRVIWVEHMDGTVGAGIALDEESVQLVHAS